METNAVASPEVQLHKFIVEGDIENVKSFLNSQSHHSQPYLNKNGKSAALVAIECKQFDIFSLLLSHDIRFVNDLERRSLKELTKDEDAKFNKALVRNSKEIKDAAVHFLQSSTKFVNNNNSDKIKDIKMYYKELNEIPEIGLIFAVIKCSGFVNIIFDFENESTDDVDRSSSSSTKGTCQYDHGRIYIGAEKHDANTLKGTIAHELTHYAMEIVYSNDCKPYQINDNNRKKRFSNIITSIYDKLSHIDEIIQLAFRSYDESEWPSELIVRVNHMLASHGAENGEALLNEQADELLKYFREHVIGHCKKFIRDFYLLKPKSEIEIFNLSTGLVTKIEESAIAFKQSLKSELEAFIGSKEHSFLVISTASSILSAIKLFQSAKELHLSLSQYLIIECEKYFKHLNVIDNLLLSDSCILLMINILDIADFDTQWSNVLNNLSAKLKARPTLKMVIVFHEDKLSVVLKQLTSQKCQYKLAMEANLAFKDLARKSQMHIVSQNVELQGERIALKTATANNRHLISANLVAKLISGDPIEIGDRLVPKSFNLNMYIPRELKLTNENGVELEMSEMELIDLICNDKVIAIADIAGSGKSTLLTHIATLIKQQLKGIWIVRVNLNSFTKAFENKLNSNDPFNSAEAIKFLIESQKSLESDAENSCFSQELFKSYLSSVVVMFDAFDEINPDYATTVESLVKATMEANVKQIWLTTRPQCKTLIETEFQCKSLEITPLNRQKQLDYLVNFWKHSLKVEDTNYILTTFGQQLQHSMFSYKDTFLENPLQLMMAAEASLDQCRETWQSLESVFDIEEKLRRIDLYEKFLSKKFSVYQDDKLELDRSKVGARKDFPKAKLFEMHQIAALKLFFNHNDVELLLSKSHVKQQDIDFEQIEMYGIVTNFSHDQPEFVHLTFAEYLVAQFIAQNTLRNEITREVAEIILKNVFMKDNYKMIRSFSNEILIEITNDIVNELQKFVFVWEECFSHESKTPILTALNEKNDKIIQLLCSCFKNSNVTHEIISTDIFLQLAARKSNKVLIKMLIEEYNVDVNSCQAIMGNETALHVACKFSTKEIAQILIDYKANVSQRDSDQKTPLHYAAQLNSKEMIKMLIDEHGANVNAVDIDGETPLHLAVENNSPEVVTMLIEDYAANVNAVNKYGRKPLHWAAESNGEEVIKMLINHGADANESDNVGRTSLLWAASRNSAKVIKMLIDDHGADVNTRDHEGITPLHRAAARNSEEITRMLCGDYGADINAGDRYGEAPLHWAVKHGSKEVIKMLIDDYKANVDAVNGKGMTPLHLAIGADFKDTIAMVAMLIDRGANLNAVDNDGNTTLHEAAKYNNKESIKMLMNNETDVNAANCNGDTPLHWTSKFNSKEVTQILVNMAANVNAFNNEGNAPLHEAAIFSSKDLIKMLINNETDVNAANHDGYPPLHLAIKYNSEEVIIMLLEDYGANVNATNSCGDTPLHIATTKNNKQLIQMLIDYKADVNAIGRVGRTPLHIAANINSNEIMKMLIVDYGANVNAVDDNGNMSLHLASKCSGKQEITMLINSETNINAANCDGNIPLHLAAAVNSREVIKMLINCETDVNAVNKKGETALHWAVRSNSKEVIEMLIEDYGADVNAVADNNRIPPLIWAYSNKNSQEVIAMLVDFYGATSQVKATPKKVEEETRYSDYESDAYLQLILSLGNSD